MRKIVMNIFILLIIFFSSSLNVSAASCTTEKINELTLQANVIETAVDLFEGNGAASEEEPIDTHVSYIISFYNMNNNFRLVSSSGQYKSEPSHIKDGRIGLRVYQVESTTLKYNVYSNEATCPGVFLRTIEVVIPEYNEFSNDEECKDIPEFYYCSKTFSSPVNLTYKEFLQLVKNYKDANKVPTEEQEKAAFPLKEVLIISSIVIAVVVVIVLIIKKRKNSINNIRERGIV